MRAPWALQLAGCNTLSVWSAIRGQKGGLARWTLQTALSPEGRAAGGDGGWAWCGSQLAVTGATAQIVRRLSCTANIGSGEHWQRGCAAGLRALTRRHVLCVPQVQEEKEYIVNSFSDFLAQFIETDTRNTSSGVAAPYYETLAKAVSARDRTTLEVDFQHLQQFDDELAERVSQDYYRIEKWLAEALKRFTKKAIPTQDQACPSFCSSNPLPAGRHRLLPLASRAFSLSRSLSLSLALFLCLFRCERLLADRQPFPQATFPGSGWDLCETI